MLEAKEKEYITLKENLEQITEQLEHERSISKKNKHLVNLCCENVSFVEKGKELDQKVQKKKDHFCRTASISSLENLIEELEYGLKEDKINQFEANDTSFREQLDDFNKEHSIKMTDNEKKGLCLDYNDQYSFIERIKSIGKIFSSSMSSVRYYEQELKKVRKQLLNLRKNVKKMLEENSIINDEIEQEVIKTEEKNIDTIVEELEKAKHAKHKWFAMVKFVKSNQETILYDDDLQEEIIEIINGKLINNFRAKDYLEKILKYNSIKEINTLIELNEMANLILSIEFDRFDHVYKEYTDLELFFNELHPGDLFYKYEFLYNKFLKKNKNIDPKKLMSPTKFRKAYNRKVKELIYKTLPNTNSNRWRMIIRAAFEMDPKDVAQIYEDYKNSLFYNYSNETKASIQKEFVALIEGRIPKQEASQYNEESTKRYVSICREYFHEEPFKEVFIKKTKNIEVEDKNYKYYKNNKLQNALNGMKFSKINRLKLMENEMYKVKVL